jgi:hypothetical protein
MITRIFSTRMTNFHRTFLAVGLLTMINAMAFAQSATPIPEIEIPVADSITYLNQWLVVFGPIFLFIGMIPVALGLLRFITRLFASAFGNSSR